MTDRDGTRYVAGRDVDVILLCGDPHGAHHVEVYTDSGGFVVESDRLRRLEIA